MQRLESDLVVNKNENLIDDYFIELRINHNIDVYIAGDSVKKINELKSFGIEIEEVVNTSAHIKSGNESYLKAKVSHGKHNLDI